MLALARLMHGPLRTLLTMPHEHAPLAHFVRLCFVFPVVDLPRPLAHRQLAAAVRVFVVNWNLVNLNLRLFRALAVPLPSLCAENLA